jgi:hypothetical protein
VPLQQDLEDSPEYVLPDAAEKHPFPGAFFLLAPGMLKFGKKPSS